MKILAIESSSLVASVAVVEDDILTAEYTTNFKKTHSQTLLPMLSEISKMIELDLRTIDAIAVSGGPGSFTGLRIGSATAKGLGLALNKPLIHVPTIDAMAFNMYGTDKLICPIMDARRNQVYTGIYQFETKKESKELLGKSSNQELKIIREQCAVSIDELIAYLTILNKEVIFIGDGVPVFKTIIQEKLGVCHYFAPAHMNRQRAAVIGTLGMRYLQQGKVESASEHKPNYLRASQAERELAEKNADPPEKIYT